MVWPVNSWDDDPIWRSLHHCSGGVGQPPTSMLYVHNCLYPLVICYIAKENGPFTDDFPHKTFIFLMDFPVRYVKLPEGGYIVPMDIGAGWEHS